MKKSIQKIVWGGVGVAVLYYLIVFFSIIPWEVNEIKDTMRRQMVISAEAYETLDPSSFVKVYANEPGACRITDEQLQRVRFAQQNPHLQPRQTGWLDIQTAYILAYQQADVLTTEIENQMVAENRLEMTLEERNTLMDFVVESGAPLLTPAVSIYPPPVHKVEPQYHPVEQNPKLPRMWVIPTGFNRVVLFYKVLSSETPSFTMRYSLIQKDNQWFITCGCRVYLRDGVCMP